MKKKDKKKKLSKLTVGIDPGQKGGIVFIKKGKILKSFLMPLIGKKVIDIHEVDSIFKKYAHRIEHVWMEQVAARPGQGVVAMFSFGHGYGVLQGLIVGNRLPFTLVRPQDWRKRMLKGVSALGKTKKKKGKKGKVKILDNKAMALIAGKRLFPHQTFIPKGKRVPQDGLVDASLIGLYGYKNKKIGKNK